MLKRFPYWGWLGLSLLLWGINILHFHAHRQEMLPHEMALTVNKSLQDKDKAFGVFLSNQALLEKLFTGSLTEKEQAKVNAFPFYIYGYQNDTLRFWNNNSVIGQNNDSSSARPTIRRNQKGIFVRKYMKLAGGRKLIVMFPLVITYPLENDYLHTHFVASENIPVKTKIVDAPTGAPGEYPLMLQGGVTAGYLVFNPSEIQKWEPDALLISMLLMAVLATLAWLQLMAMHIARNRPAIAAGIIAALIVTIRLLLFRYGLPFHLDALTIFSPTLYASSQFLSSLGDLFISLILALWFIIFIARHTHYKTYLAKITNTPLRIAATIVTTFLLTAYTSFFVNIVQSLILDSSISFDVTHFYAISIYTVFGLLAIITITAISCMVIYILNTQLTVLVRNKWLKYAIITAGALTLFGAAGVLENYFAWYLMASLLLFVFLLDIPSFKLVSRLFEPHMIIWALIFCSFCTAIIRYFNEVKEENARRAFVEQHLTPHRDDEVEFSFDNTAKKIERDSQLKSFFYSPSANGRKLVNQHFETQYLTGQVNNYEAIVYLFDAKFQRLFNKDTTDYETLMDEKKESVLTNSGYLFYKESILDRHYYLSYIPVYSDTVNNIIGYVIIDLDLKKTKTETVYPELLQPAGNKAATGDNEYAYAVYVNGKLINQTNDYPFPVRLKHDTLQEQQYVYQERNGNKELIYKIADKRTVIVVHYHSEWLEAVTLFSYLFGIQILIALLIFGYQLYLSYFSGQHLKGRFVRLTLRRRVHLSMLAVVFVSFIIIGYVTIIFFTSEYKKSNAGKLQAAMQVAKQSVQDYLADEDAFNNDYIFDTVSKSAGFKTFITELANTQKIDINIFDDEGELFATSQDEIYDKGLISRMMRPDAYYGLASAGKSLVIQNERVGQLSYSSAYQPLRDERGITMGYINVPFFSSEKDLDFQISNIVVTLINLYAFIFLISSVITVGITRWITSTFDIIIKQFDKLNLEKNERIVWQYDDEIGKLVNEYNKMVKKVEENAASLAQSERESAWREMARQVAHEIKNPLTPMKLNIQYLQQAMRNDNPNIKQLTDRVSDSIIEQIDNLSYIASEFSNFAKMPEAKPEEINLGELLGKAVELYNNNDVLDITLTQPKEPVLVMSDRSQLLRVFTNLLENAKQAIPQGNSGLVNVSMGIEGDDAVIAIADNGTGIPEDIAKRIFQPYFTTKSSGTGLGLAMTKKIIEFWKGEIWFTTIENEGTTFFIKLPLLSANAHQG
jgi:signal transduction histidine kinase